MRESQRRKNHYFAPFELVLLFVAALLLLSSCDTVDAFRVARANSLQRSGYAHEAAALYLKAGAGTEPVASYDLANVFAMLGEAAPARSMYEVTIASGVAGLAARSWYNIGAASYARGEYPEAVAAFRIVLESLVTVKGETELVHEASRAFELAMKAHEESRNAGVTERSRYGSDNPGGVLQPFALSRTDEKTLFAPGIHEPGSVEDH